MPSPIENEVIQALVTYLDEYFGEHQRGRWLVDVDREPGEQKASSYTGRMQSEDAEAIAKKLPCIHDYLLKGKLKKIVDASTQDESSQLATAAFTFQRDGSSWKHKGFVHTVADKKALEADRAELDKRLRALLEGGVSDGWEGVSLYYTWNAPLRFVRMVGGKPETLPSEGAVDELIADYVSFFAKRGHGLETMTARIKAKPKDLFELAVAYGAPRAS